MGQFVRFSDDVTTWHHMTTSFRPTALDPSVNIQIDYNHIVDAQFLRHMLDGRLVIGRGDNWITSAGEDSVPGDVMAKYNYSGAGRTEVLIGLDGAIAHIVLTELALHVRVAAESEPACQVAIDQIREAMPPDPGSDQGREVPVGFWWWTQQGPREMGRRMSVPSWQEISNNYSARTLETLEDVMSWTAGPPPGGRLMLWHGAPGTGKTTAIRALASAWRSWADFQFITDPECFLQTPRYLLDTLASNRQMPDRSRWRVLVLEDSGEFLAPDAKLVAGQGISRLLNVCDGVLGQATQSLILVTTNEHLRTLHPALSRPGRCLSQVEFHDLKRRRDRGLVSKPRGRAASASQRGARRALRSGRWSF